ncbi:MAG: hypothetical protein O3C43_02360 [Verrucomicrobia bacterium]|nr:hypothetical protein [Verrucomicrobiota bacterium]MDA1065327.1 hypothetical protein [Verrucomicrobiota bacterium]
MRNKQAPIKSTFLDGIRTHPWISAIFMFCVVLWISIALIFLPEGWSELRKIAAGVIWGLFCATIVTATRTVGNSD